MKGIMKAGVLLTLVASTAACGSDDGGDAGSKAATLTVTGTVTKVVLVGVRPPAPGVTVCGLDRPDIPCATTDDDGKYVLPGVPMDSEGALVFSKPGYLDTIVPGRTEQEDLTVDSTVIDEVLAGTFADVLGMKSFGDAGVIAVEALKPELVGLAGARVSLEPMGSAKGPIYISDAGEPDESLTATTSYGVAWLGNVAPGEALIQLAHAERTCSVERGWAGGENGGKLPVRAHGVTITTFLCQ